MVSSLVLLLGIGVFQLGLLLHVRNTLVACAAEGARAGARADATSADAVSRTRSLITQSLSAEYAGQVSAHQASTGEGIQVVEVSVTAPTPVIGLLGPTETMSVTGRAFCRGPGGAAMTTAQRSAATRRSTRRVVPLAESAVAGTWPADAVVPAAQGAAR